MLIIFMGLFPQYCFNVEQLGWIGSKANEYSGMYQ